MKKNTLLVAMVVMTGGALSGCGSMQVGKQKFQPLPPEAVAVQTVESTNQSIGDTFLGTVTPYIQTSLAPGASGQLSELNVRVGQMVQTGQVLATLSNATAVPAENSAAQANAALVSAEQAYAAEQALYNDNTSSQQQVISAQNNVSEQKAAVQAAEVNLQKAELQEQGTLGGTATLPQDTTALQQEITSDQSALASAQQELQIAQSNLQLASQTLTTAKQEYGSITESQVEQASQAYQNELSDYQGWQSGGYAGSNPYSNTLTADQTVYNNLNSGYTTLQSDQQQYNQADQSVSQAQSTISSDEAQIANAQKASADDAPPTSSSNTAQQAKANVTAAETSLNQAKVEYAAAVSSLKLAESVADDKTQAKASLVSSENQLQQDKVSVKTAQSSLQVQLQDGQVISPISGVVQSVGAQVGQEIGPSTNLVTIATTNPTQVTVDVPEPDIGKVQKGSSMNVSFPALDETYQGTVLDIEPQLSPSTNEYPVDILISGNHSDLLQGMQAEAQLQNTAEQKEILVPADAVLSLQSGAEEVFVESNNKVHSEIVEVGTMTSTQYQITSGLAVGQKIVVQGQNLLSDGDTVKVVSADGVAVHMAASSFQSKNHAAKKNRK